MKGSASSAWIGIIVALPLLACSSQNRESAASVTSPTTGDKSLPTEDMCVIPEIGGRAPLCTCDSFGSGVPSAVALAAGTDASFACIDMSPTCPDTPSAVQLSGAWPSRRVDPRIIPPVAYYTCSKDTCKTNPNPAILRLQRGSAAEAEVGIATFSIQGGTTMITIYPVPPQGNAVKALDGTIPFALLPPTAGYADMTRPVDMPNGTIAYLPHQLDCTGDPDPMKKPCVCSRC